MANYLTTDTDLTAVADAIRTKGGTSADRPNRHDQGAGYGGYDDHQRLGEGQPRPVVGGAGANRLRDGQKCLLRNNMLHTYYKHRENRTIRQYEYENFEMEYKAYKALKGNSFIDRIYSEIKEYEIVS